MNIKFISILLVFLGACNKYDDGPGFTIRGFNKRIAGVYTITSFAVNNTDNLDSLRSYGLISTFELSPKTGNKETILCTRAGYGGEWYLNNFRNEFVTERPLFSTKVGENLFPCLVENSTWTIDRCSMKELWIKTTIRDTLYEIKLTE